MPRFYRIQTSLVFLLIGFSLAVLFRSQLAYPGQPVPIVGRRRRAMRFERRISRIGHDCMRGFYTIHTQADFNAWLTSQPAGL
jgi:hypothetical protein